MESNDQEAPMADPLGRPFRAYTSSTRMDVPHDWVVKESVTISEPSGAANIIVSRSSNTSEGSLEDLIREQQIAYQNEFPQYLPIGTEEHFILPGVHEPAVLVEYTFSVEDGRRIWQTQINAIGNGLIYTGTATTTMDGQGYALRAVLFAALTSIVVGDMTSDEEFVVTEDAPPRPHRS